VRYPCRRPDESPRAPRARSDPRALTAPRIRGPHASLMSMLAAVVCALGLHADAVAPRSSAIVTFSPPTWLGPLVECLYCANWRTYRAGTKKGTWSTAIVGSPSSDPNYKGLVSSDGGRTVKRSSPIGGKAWGNPFVTMPDGSQHNTGSAGRGFANTTRSSSFSSAWWNVTEDGTVIAAHDGPAASFAGLPSPLICNSTDDCVYGAGYETWSQAARLADGTFVTCTAFVWLCGHFAVPAELAGIHAWRSDDSYNWTWIGRPAALTELTGYLAPGPTPEEPAWFGPGEGPNEHDLVLLVSTRLACPPSAPWPVSHPSARSPGRMRVSRQTEKR
jgi:hypothetical protein